ncbi:MAG: SHOCT domain-containing protein [Burkholderiaceae bacterium]|nr:SHOCT domain-containing protein [Burkholderiaceae bacterium]
MTYDIVHMIGMTWFWWLLWLALVAAVYFTPRRSSGRRGKSPKEETTDEMLRRRLDSGEMTKQEYERYKTLLERDASSAG